MTGSFKPILKYADVIKVINQQYVKYIKIYDIITNWGIIILMKY